MRIRKSICLILFFACAALYAGDSATYVDLGFSPDGRVYFFGQYGIQAETLQPWAELNGVNVIQNNFVAGGRLSYTHDSAITPGQDGSGALFQLISRNSALTGRYGLDFMRQGLSLYLDLDGARADDSAASDSMAIAFRDFEQGSSYAATLVSRVDSPSGGLQSSFYIDLEITSRDGTKKTYMVGNPQVNRAQIASYRINRVMLSPRKDALVFVIEMKRLGSAGYDIRYMIETLGL